MVCCGVCCRVCLQRMNQPYILTYGCLVLRVCPLQETFGKVERHATTADLAQREMVVVLGSVLMSRLEGRWNDRCCEDHTLQLYLRLALFAIKTNLQETTQARIASNLLMELLDEEEAAAGGKGGKAKGSKGQGGGGGGGRGGGESGRAARRERGTGLE